MREEIEAIAESIYQAGINDGLKHGPITLLWGRPQPNFLRLKALIDRLTRERDAAQVAEQKLRATLEKVLPTMKLFYSFYGDDEHTSSLAEAIQFREAMQTIETAIKQESFNAAT